MTIAYHGENQNLAKELRHAQEALDRRYAEILGPERTLRLWDAASTLLRPECFFDDPAAWHRYSGDRIPPERTNRMIIAASIDELTISPQGIVAPGEARTAVGFYVSEEGFARSDARQFTESRLGSYVHVYNHFVCYALQRVPMYLVQGAVGEVLSGKVEVDLAPYARNFGLQPTPETELGVRTALSLYAQRLEETFQKASSILDKLVLDAVGIKVPLPWRGGIPNRNPVPIPPKMLVMVPTDGDPFHKDDDYEAVRRVLDWERELNAANTLPLFYNIVSSVKSIKVERLPLDEFMRLQRARRATERSLPS